MIATIKGVGPLTLGERIKKVRKYFDLTQREFGERISIKQNSVAQIEMGRNTSDQTIFSICREFNINETWLRTGEGEMLVQQSKGDELSAAVNQLLSGESSEFKRRLIVVLSKLDIKEWEMLEKRLNEITGARTEPGPLDSKAQEREKPAEQSKPLTIDEQVELYRQQLILEQEQAK